MGGFGVSQKGSNNIPNEDDLSPTQKKILDFFRTNMCNLSPEKVAQELGLPVEAILRESKKFRKVGWLRANRQNGRITGFSYVPELATISTLSNSVSRYLHLTPKEQLVLQYIHKHPGSTILDISKDLSIPHPDSLEKTLRDFAKGGLIHYGVGSPGRGRSRLIYFIDDFEDLFSHKTAHESIISALLERTTDSNKLEGLLKIPKSVISCYLDGIEELVSDPKKLYLGKTDEKVLNYLASSQTSTVEKTGAELNMPTESVLIHLQNLRGCGFIKQQKAYSLK